MKKKMLLFLALALVLGVMAGCQSPAESKEEPKKDPDKKVEEPKKDEEVAESEDVKSVTLKFGMVAGNQSNEYKAAEKLAELVSQKSDGKFTIELFPNSQLGDDRAMLEQLTAGALDITLAETGRLGIWVPSAELAGLPYMFEDFSHLKKVVEDTEYGKSLRKEFYDKYNWKILTTSYNGTRQTSSNKEIKSIEDMKGLKLRTPQHQPLLDYAEYVGASPTPMAFTEVYLALQTNAIGAQENPLSTIKAVKFHEVQKYIAMTNHVINDANYIVSKQTWESLPENFQSILQESATEAGLFHTEMFENEEKELISFFEGEGLTVTKPDLEPFREAVKKSYPAYFEKIGEGAEDAFKMIQDAK